MRTVFYRSFLLKVTGTLLCVLLSQKMFAITEQDHFSSFQTPAEVDSLLDLAGKISYVNMLQYEEVSTLALSIARRINYQKGIALALFRVGGSYYYKEEYYKSFSCYFESLDLYEKLKDVDGQIRVITQLATGYLLFRNTENALKYIRQAESKIPFTKNHGIIGIVHQLMANYDYQNKLSLKAEKETYLAIYYFRKADDIKGESQAYKLLGDVYLQKRQLYRSINSYHIALQKCNAYGNLNEVGVLYTRIAHVYQLLSDYRTVLGFNFRSLKVREAVGNQELIASSLINIGATYLQLPDYDSSLYYLRSGLTMARSFKKNFMLENAYLQLYNYYTEVKDYQQALKFYEHYSEVHKRVLLDRNNSEIHKLEAGRMIREAENKNEILKKGNDIQRLEIRNSHIRTFFFEVLFLAALVLVIFIYSQHSHNIKSRNLLHTLNQRLEEEIRVRSEAEEKLKQSEELYRFMTENSLDVISHLDRNLKRLYISPSCIKFYGYDQEEMYRMKNIFEIIHLDFHQYLQSVFDGMLETKLPAQFTYKAIRKDGSEFWAESVANPVVDEITGELKEWITVVRDVTTRKKHEEEVDENARQKEILLKEIHHRVKNNFAVMVSLMNMQKEISGDSKLTQALSELQLRVRTMSLVHEQLYKKDSIHDIPLGEYILHLATIISDAFNNQMVKLQTEIEEGMVNIEVALPLGLIINELLTNSYKYAFPGDRQGIISIRLFPSAPANSKTDPDKKYWDLIIQDDGIGLPQSFNMKEKAGMGSQIVQILVEQIEAKLEISNKNGAFFRIQFIA